MIVHVGNEVFSGIRLVRYGHHKIEMESDDREITIETEAHVWIEEQIR